MYTPVDISGNPTLVVPSSHFVPPPESRQTNVEGTEELGKIVRALQCVLFDHYLAPDLKSTYSNSEEQSYIVPLNRTGPNQQAAEEVGSRLDAELNHLAKVLETPREFALSIRSGKKNTASINEASQWLRRACNLSRTLVAKKLISVDDGDGEIKRYQLVPCEKAAYDEALHLLQPPSETALEPRTISVLTPLGENFLVTIDNCLVYVPDKELYAQIVKKGKGRYKGRWEPRRCNAFHVVKVDTEEDEDEQACNGELDL